MQNKKIIASLLLIMILWGLNIIHRSFKQEALANNSCKERLFIEIYEKGKRPTVKGYCKKPDSIISKCNLKNGLRIIILKNGKVICRDMSPYKKITLGIAVSINKESAYGLCAIPGIGPYLAKEIIKERRKRGGFNKLEELLQIKGIGNNLYKRILPYISL